MSEGGWNKAKITQLYQSVSRFNKRRRLINMYQKKVFFILGILLVMSLVLAACGSGGSNAPTGGNDADDEGGGGEMEPVVLRFLKMADELEAQALAEMVNAFQKSEGGKWSYVSIEIDAKPFMELFPAIEKAVATDSDIDLIQADGPDVKHFAFNNMLYDLTDHFTEAEMAQWAPQSVVEGSMTGRFYGPPEVQSCQLMWFNVDMLDAAGIDYSSIGMTESQVARKSGHS